MGQRLNTEGQSYEIHFKKSTGQKFYNIGFGDINNTGNKLHQNYNDFCTKGHVPE